MLDRRTMLGGAVALPIAARAAATQTRPGEALTAFPPREHFRLWPGRPPGARATLPTYAPSMNGRPQARELWLRGVADPLVAVYRPARPNGTAVLSIPGGGYGFVSVENEGIDVARTLTPFGITVFVLSYRLPGEGWDDATAVPLQDAQRAMRLIRADARRYGIDPARLGTLGFSAGGHLAGSLTVAHDERVYAPLDAADRQAARPAFTGLVYPVADIAAMNRIGEGAALATYRRYDVPARITAATPPLFLAHAMDDGLVPVDQSLALIAAARRAKVPVEAHLFENGGHGFGALHMPEESPQRRWTDLFARWVAGHIKPA